MSVTIQTNLQDVKYTDGSVMETRPIDVMLYTPSFDGGVENIERAVFCVYEGWDGGQVAKQLGDAVHALALAYIRKTVK